MKKITSPLALLSAGWSLFTSHWKILVPILVLPTIISYVGTLVRFSDALILDILGILISIVGGVLSVVMIPAMVGAVHKLSTGHGTNISLKKQYRFGFGYFWSLILIGIIYIPVGFGSFLLFVIPGIVVWLYVSLYAYTLVIDGKKGFSALTESYSLIRGRWWPVFGRVLFLILIMLVIWAVFIGIMSLVGMAVGIDIWSNGEVQNLAMSSSIGPAVLGMIMNLVGMSILGTIAIGYNYHLYTSLKETREHNVQTGAFKKWLVAFLCVGIVGIVVLMVSIPFLIAISAKNYIQNNVQQTQESLRSQIEAYSAATTTIQLESPTDIESM